MSLENWKRGLLMKERRNRQEKRKGFSLLFSIVLIFGILGTIVFWLSQKTSREMSDASIQNLSESLDLIQSTIEAILCNEVQFQELVAREIARSEDPEAYIRACEENQMMSKIAMIPSGETEGIASTGDGI